MRTRAVLLACLAGSFAAASPWAASPWQGRAGGVAAPQRGAGPAALPPPTGTGIIVGQVVDGSTSRPVAGAIVTMSGTAVLAPPNAANGGAGPSAPGAAPIGPAGRSAQAPVQQVPAQRVMTDGDGRFIFYELPKGSFNLTATAPGYTNAGYGQRKPEGASRPLALDTGQRVSDVALRIWKHAAITGTVVDEFGDPLVGINVRALRRTLVSGQPRLVPGSSAQTDDRGVYRFGTLVAGDYLVTIPNGTTSVPTSLVDLYTQAMMVPPGGRGPDQQAAQQQRMQLIQELNSSGAPIPSGGGTRVGDSQLQPMNALSRTTPPPTDAGRVLVYQTTFYPSSATVTMAQVITLASGDERTGVDLQMRLVATARVAGTLTGPGGPVPNVGLKLLPADGKDLASDLGFETATTVTDATGAFTFLGVPSGQYVLRAQKIPRLMNVAFDMGLGFVPGGRGVQPPQPPAIVEPTLWAEAPVTVGDADVANLAVSFREGARISGRVEFEGALTKPTTDRLQLVTVSVNPLDSRSGGAYQPARVHADGQFTSMEYLPGKYWITASSPGAGWVLKSVMANGRDATETPVALDASDVTGVVVTYTDKTTQISGSVQAAAGATTDSGSIVLIFPLNYQQWIDNGMAARMTRQARPSSAGTFQIASLPPGDYFIAAVPDDLSSDWQEPATLAAIARSATRVTIAEGEKKTADLRVSQIR